MPVLNRFSRVATVAGLAIVFGAAATLSKPSKGYADIGSRPAAGTLTYRVKLGDTVSEIAERYGVRADALVVNNGIKNKHFIREGDKLVIPASVQAPVQSSARQANALPPALRPNSSRSALVPVFDKWAKAYDIAPDILKATTWLESGWQNQLVSSANARGIGQLQPDTVDFVSRRLLKTKLKVAVPEDNIRMSARYLRYLLDSNQGNVDAALASYYQGLASVRKVGPYPATRHYVADVKALRSLFQ